MSNEELQKAIDDLTKENKDSGAIAPATPAAAMPTGGVPDDMMPADSSAADAMPTSDAAVAAVSDATPIAPPPVAPSVASMSPAAAAEAPAPAQRPDLGEGVTLGADGLIDVNTTVSVAEKVSNIPTEEPAANLLKVKQDALRELFPLMNKLNIDPVQKFGLYKDIIDLTKEHSAIEQAHETVLQIADDQTRADALLELLEIISGFKV